MRRSGCSAQKKIFNWVAKMRKKIYKMVHVYEGNTFSVAYKYFMIAIIAVSLIPLTTKEKPSYLGITE